MDTTLPHTSRIQVGGFSNLPTANTFGALSNFLREAISDEESRLFSESMGQLALHAEAVVAGLRLDRHRDHAAPLLMDMLTVIRDHRTLVVDLGLAWRGLYEYPAYLQALNNLRVLIGQWLLHTDPWDDTVRVTAEEFHQVSWRILGEGMLLIDMYEQWLDNEVAGQPRSALGELGPPQVDRVLQWWHKLRR
ncbi:MAG TPA: hypothetical protein VHL79_10605 [Ramlibacter sp.]|jgi:hypothetical protein|nr:hypothetical protein [Ramlibacter sp.]